MSDLYANLVRSAVAEMDRRAKTISPNARVRLDCQSSYWRLWIDLDEGSSRVSRFFDGETPHEALTRAEEFLTEHEPAKVAQALGLEPATSTQSA